MIPEHGSVEELKELLLRAIDFAPRKGCYLFKKPGRSRWRLIEVDRLVTVCEDAAKVKTHHVFYWFSYQGRTHTKDGSMTVMRWFELCSQRRIVPLVVVSREQGWAKYGPDPTRLMHGKPPYRGYPDDLWVGKALG